MERDLIGVLKIGVIQISTHTLTWSVTTNVISDSTLKKNFNSHAHVERDLFMYSLVSPRDYFNSHAHVERDNFSYITPVVAINFNSHAHVERDIGINAAIINKNISTHTLTWSVTNFRKITASSDTFQLTRSRGA